MKILSGKYWLRALPVISILLSALLLIEFGTAGSCYDGDARNTDFVLCQIAAGDHAHDALPGENDNNHELKFLNNFSKNYFPGSAFYTCSRFDKPFLKHIPSYYYETDTSPPGVSS